MKRIKGLFIMSSLLCILLVGCTRKTDILSHKENKSVITYNSDKTQYNINNLTIGDDIEKITKTLGTPKDKCYEVVGTYPLVDQSLYTFYLYDEITITSRTFFKESKDLIKENGLIEIDIRSGNYQTKEGIKIGDSLNDVIKKYNIQSVFKYGEKDGMISDLIYNRVTGLETYKKRDFYYDYGKIDKIAYIISDEKFENPLNIPALIFLIHDNKVTHIIVTNTLAL